MQLKVLQISLSEFFEFTAIDPNTMPHYQLLGYSVYSHVACFVNVTQASCAYNPQFYPIRSSLT